MAIWATIGAIPGWFWALYLLLVAPPIGLAVIVFLNVPGTLLLVRYFQVNRGTVPVTDRAPWWGTAVYNGLLALGTFGTAAAADGATGLAVWGFVLTGITWLAVDTAHRVVGKAREQEFAEAIVEHGWA